MIIVDKLCYLSKLRYVNPMEKFVFAMLTLIFCIVSRSIVMGILTIAVNSWLTIVRGGISAARYRNLMMVPLAFLLLSTAAIIINISRLLRPLQFPSEAGTSLEVLQVSSMEHSLSSRHWPLYHACIFCPSTRL